MLVAAKHDLLHGELKKKLTIHDKHKLEARCREVELKLVGIHQNMMGTYICLHFMDRYMHGTFSADTYICIRGCIRLVFSIALYVFLTIYIDRSIDTLLIDRDSFIRHSRFI